MHLSILDGVGTTELTTAVPPLSPVRDFGRASRSRIAGGTRISREVGSRMPCQKGQARIDLFLPSPSRRIQRVPRTVPDRSTKMSVEGHRSFLGRFILTSLAASAIELGYFFASSNFFLWKSSDWAEKI